MGVEVRMESWLSADTIRRMGFGHVVAGRHHASDRGAGCQLRGTRSHGTGDSDGYAANIFSPQPRYLIRTGS